MKSQAASPTVRLWPARACLVSALAEELAGLSANELAATQVVLPTQRLPTWLYALLAKRRGGAVLPPRAFTFDAWVLAWARELTPAPAGRVLGALEEELLAGGLLQDGGYKHLAFGHAHEACQLFAELTQWDLGEEAFTKLAEVLSGNVYLSDGGVDTLSERAAELQDLYRRFLAKAQEMGAVPAAVRQAATSRALAVALATAETLPAPRLYVVGMTSAHGMHAALLKALAERPEARIWVSEPPPLGGKKQPLELLLGMLGVARRAGASAAAPVADLRQAATLGDPAAADGLALKQLEVMRADTVFSEVDQALRLAETAVASGMPASAIALLVTNDAVYGKPLRLLLARSPLGPGNVALGTPLAGTAIGSWTLALLDLMAADGDAPSLAAFLSHPLTLAWHGEGDLREAVVRDLANGRLSRPVEAYADAALGALGPAFAARETAAYPLSEWAEGLTSAAADMAGKARTEAHGEDIGVARSSREQLDVFLTELRAAAGLIRSPLTRGQLVILLKSKIQSLEVRSVGEPLAGLQVLSVAEARYVPFELGIVLGALEGDFPRALPKDHLLDNYLKGRIGLPGWSLLEAIEDTTFHLLRERLPRMVLCYPVRRGAEPTVRSRFIEAALASGAAEETLAAGDSSLDLAARMGGVSPLRQPAVIARALRPSNNSGLPEGADPQGELPEEIDREALLGTLSASALEALIRCPYRFLLQRLKVNTLDFKDDDDPRDEGDWLHGVLEAFFTGKTDDRTVAPPLMGDVPWSELRAYALARLEDLTHALAPPGGPHAALLLHLRHTAWPAFVDHLMRLYTPGTWARALSGWREQALAGPDGGALSFEVGGRTVRMRGAIDCVETPGGLHVITDYKRAGAPEKGEVLNGLSPQLLVYAKATAAMSAELPLSRAVAGYWSILKGAWQLGLAGDEAADAARALGLISPRDGAELLPAVDRLMAQWEERQSALTGAGAAFRPDQRACGFCGYTGICRKNDPAFRLETAEVSP